MRCRALPVSCLVAAMLGLASWPSSASAQEFAIKPIAEKKTDSLPAGPLYWRIENFSTLREAQSAATSTGLTAEAAGKAWLFTLAPKGGASPGGIFVAEVGPIPAISAPSYLLRINNAGGPPGARTSVHTHAGSESFYVLTGWLTQKNPLGENLVGPGQSMSGREPGMPMEVSSTGAENLNALVMFVVDATKPFSSPAAMH